MITLIENLPRNIIGFKYDEEVTADDYETILFPAFEVASANMEHFNVLCELGENFTNIKPGAIKDDLEIGLRYFRKWKKIALISDKQWVNHTVQALRFIIPGHVRTFTTDKKKEAIDWLSAPV